MWKSRLEGGATKRPTPKNEGPFEGQDKWGTLKIEKPPWLQG
jgi:hypothetical protein